MSRAVSLPRCLRTSAIRSACDGRPCRRGAASSSEAVEAAGFAGFSGEAAGRGPGAGGRACRWLVGVRVSRFAIAAPGLAGRFPVNEDFDRFDERLASVDLPLGGFDVRGQFGFELVDLRAGLFDVHPLQILDRNLLRRFLPCHRFKPPWLLNCFYRPALSPPSIAGGRPAFAGWLPIGYLACWSYGTFGRDDSRKCFGRDSNPVRDEG